MTKLFITLANSKNDKTCLTIDCTSLNTNGPGRYRTEAADPDKHTCYFNKSDDDTLYNIFISKRIKEKPNKLLFKIEGLKTQTDDETYSASSELENLQGNGLSNARNTELETGYGNREVNGSVLNQDFFQDDNTIQKKQKRKISTKKPRKVKTPYSPTKIKARNYLSNISYSPICEDDFKNLSFIADKLSFITMDLKPFFIKITYGDERDIDMIKFLWEECLPKTYLLYLKKPENFELINSEKSNFKTIKILVQQYMSVSENCQYLINSFQKHHDIYQYIIRMFFRRPILKKLVFGNKYNLRNNLILGNRRCSNLI